MKNAVCRLCRREQAKLFLKGERCYSPKCSVTKRPYAPGAAGQNKSGKMSDYNKQLRAKQKAKAIYRVRETQFKNYYLQASKTRGQKGVALLQLLERRLDNVVYKLSFASSREEAKQLVSHRKIMVNNKILNINSYLVEVGDEIKLITKNQKLVNKDVPIWLDLNKKDFSGKIVNIPNRDEIEQEINEQLIVEFYSR